MKVSEYLNKIATENEMIAEATFKNLGFHSTKLDKLRSHRKIPGPHDRPDYHFSASSGTLPDDIFIAVRKGFLTALGKHV
jgi:hypothetical protein